MKAARSIIPLALVAAIAGGLTWWYVQKTDSPPASGPGIPIDQPLGDHPALSSLASPPDWSELDPWQSTISRENFVDQLESVFTVTSSWRDWFHIGEKDVLIETGVDDERYRLRFAEKSLTQTPSRSWRTASELDPATAERPLEDVHIAIDPGHIGGRWAKIEERWFQVGEDPPVQEGDMTLLVAKLLRPRLEALGADVSLVRDQLEPVTDYRPESLMDAAREIQPDSPQQLAERLFYRTAEIRARAEKVNDELKPDLVLCLHFNAEGWGNPEDPTLVDRHHFHLLVNGAYTDGEIALADQRHHAVRKIVEGIHDEEVALAGAIASRFANDTRLPPYLYEINSKRALNIDSNPYIWARNLLANRLYQCPVVFLEPYVMNSTLDYPRIQAGDYKGTRKVAGKDQPSIFREYADSVAAGLAEYYRAARPIE
ncbi:hypothetical protein [Haloferula sp. A504]|uniref:hypothetical protein n=1 Tax=Haloferula sp. A504 TaxID=3373601 RepID=UPI0031BDB28E|nr:N-acetylmuramoyl-L-alanine amidase [Verrucomicrobiaceae bacterium E54]